MLLKLDHVTYSVSKEKYSLLEEKLLSFGYQIKFSEKRLKNPQNKREFMVHFQECSDVIYFEKNQEISIEVIIYDIISQEFHVVEGYFDDTLDFYVHHIDSMKQILMAVGGKGTGESEISFCDFFSKKEYGVRLLQQQSPSVWTCDTEGTGCLTFLVHSCEKLKDKLRTSYLCSEIEEMTVNGTKLDVFFIQNEFRDFVEIISMKKVTK